MLLSFIPTQQMGLQQSWFHSANRNLNATHRLLWELARQVCQEQPVNGCAVPFDNVGVLSVCAFPLQRSLGVTRVAAVSLPVYRCSCQSDAFLQAGR